MQEKSGIRAGVFNKHPDRRWQNKMLLAELVLANDGVICRIINSHVINYGVRYL